MILDLLGNAHKILMIQGPFGPFFQSIGARLEQEGYHITKINLNAGDAWYYPSGINFTGTLHQWPEWLTQCIQDKQIDAIIVFSDARIYHRLAHDVALKYNTPFFVFEEGYLRPNWITLEPWGVNAHSTLSRKASDYQEEPPPPPPDHEMQDHFTYRAALAFWYYLLNLVFKYRFPHYQHHREISVSEFFRWVRGGFRKIWYKWRQRHILDAIKQEWAGRTFLMPLQVHNDSQLWMHGGHSMESYIEQTMSSFAHHAPADCALVIKHHPLDRAYRDYTSLILKLSQELRLIGRVFYSHDIHLPSLFPLLRGTVTVNSSVGMTSLEQGVPVKTLGRAIYHITGLTHQGSLDSFWHNPTPVDINLSKRYRGWLIAKCQLQGAVYQPELMVDPRAFLPPQSKPPLKPVMSQPMGSGSEQKDYAKPVLVESSHKR